MYTTMTLGAEYARNALVRTYKSYFDIGRFGCKITTRNDFYKAMVNSSMICWMNMESGHLEYTNVRFCYNGMDVIDMKYCRIELNHEVLLFVMFGSGALPQSGQVIL